MERRPPQLEWLEPRVLHSVDLAPPLAPDTGAECAQVRLLDEPLDLAAGDVLESAHPNLPGHARAAAAGDEACGTVAARIELAFIDASLNGREMLSDAARGAGLEVVWLDGQRPGLQQIADALAGHGRVDALHLLTHGAPGVLQIGSDRIDFTTADATRDALLARIGTQLDDAADLLIYGCEFAAGEAGGAAVASLARLVGADIGASIDATGTANRGGNWTLETVAGTLDTGPLDLPQWLGTLAAPVLDTGAMVVFNLVREGETNPPGQSVAALVVDGSVTDPDGPAIEAIAVTGVNASLGAWQVSLDTGATWLTVDAERLNSISSELALLLAPTAQIRLLPYGDLNGSLTDAITFRAWDQSSGTSGQYVVIAASGGTTAFSAAADTASITVTAINDAPSFLRGDGIVTTAVSPGFDEGWAMAVQPDGKIVVVGTAQTGTFDFALVRYNPDGTRDTSFGSAGTVTTDLSGATDIAYAVTIQPDGMILVAGQSMGLNTDFALARYRADGSLDAAFGTGGIVRTPIGTSTDIARAIALQSGGHIVLAGSVTDPVSGFSDIGLARYTASGVLDTSFGTSGKVITTLSAGSDGARGLVIQPDGRILLAGFMTPGSSSDIALVRYTGDGALDTSFDLDGVVRTDIGGSIDAAYAVALQPDGRILVAGETHAGAQDYNFVVARYGPTGSPDITFGAAGVLPVTFGASDDAGLAIALQPDGRIIAAGRTFVPAFYDMALLRVTASGALDTTFDGDGRRIVSIGDNDEARALAIQPDGRILVAGSSAFGGLRDFVLLRLSADGALDTRLDLASTLGGTVFLNEGGSVSLDLNVSVFDAELSAAGSYAGATLTLSRNGGASAQDLFVAGVFLSPLIEGGALTVSGVTVGTVTANSAGTLRLTFDANATEARVNTVMRNINYENASDAPPASVQIDWSFSDGNAGAQGSGGALAATGSVTVAITGINDAPTLAAGRTHTLAPTNEDTTSPATLVSTLLASAGWADADTGALSGIAISAASGRGTWQYSTDGTTWTAFGAVSTASSLLLDASTQVRYLPDTIAGETASFIYRAWDQTSGTASTLATPAYASTATSGGSSAFSANSAVAQIAVASVNDAPVLGTAASPTLGSVLEGATNPAGVSVAALLVDGSLTDIDGTAIEALAITAVNTSLGAWQYSLDGGTNWLTVDADKLNSATNELALLLAPTARLRLLPFGDLNGALASALTFRAWDQTSGASGQYGVIAATGGTSAFSAASDTASITVTAVNDAPSFLRGDGIVTTSLNAGLELETAYSSVIQPDGKILLGGFSTSGTNADFALVRYNPDGSLDSTFGSEGRVTVGIGMGNDYGTRVALQSDGRILLGGVTTSTGARAFALTRFQSDGSLDTSFGTNGHVITPFGTNMDAWDMAVQPDDRIVLGGYATFGETFDFVLVRYRNDGTLDTAFGTDGKVATGFGVGNDVAYTLAIQSDGRILLAGTAQIAGRLDFALARYTVDGALDPTFGDSGKVRTAFGETNDSGRTLALQPDGRVLLGGFTTVGGGLEFALTRYTSSGALDTTFGTNGKVVTEIGIGSSAPYSIGVTADGRIVLAGAVELAGGYALALARYQPDGSLDGSFGAAGIVTTGVGDEGTARSVNLLPDGRIVIAGDARIDGRYDFMVARYSADGSLDASFDVAGTLGGAVSYSEGGSPVVLDADVRVFDAELAAAGAYAGATLTLARNGGASAQDLFSATGTLGPLTQGGALVVGGVTIGTVTANSAGTLTLTFDTAATEARVNAVMQQIAYSNSSDAPPSSVQIDWTFSDANAGVQGSGGALAATGSVTVTITGTNDAPTLAAGHTHSLAPTDEDTASPATLVSTLLVSAGWADADAGALSGIAISAASGRGTWQYSTDGTTWTAFGAVATSGSLLLDASTQVRYLPDAIAGETASFTYRAWDQTAGTPSTNAVRSYASTATTGGASAFSANSALAQIAVSSVNDAPVLNAAASPTLGSVLEGATNPAGVSVAALVVDGSLTDVDSAAVEALAITGVNASLGAWQVSLDGGTNWLTIDADRLNSTTNELALLLAPTAQIRLLPFGDLNGSLTDALTFRAWDQTSGTSGQYAVISATGGSTAYSAASDTASISVAAVNDAPTFMRGDGIVTTLIGGQYSTGYSMIVQPDGRIVLAGDTLSGGGSSNFALARYLPDGSLDSSFGAGGTVTTVVTSGSDTGYELIRQPDGKLLLGGYASPAGTPAFAVARYNADGSLDTSFGTLGIVTVSPTPAIYYAFGMAIAPDGRILLAGHAATGADFTLVRLNADGSRDSGFGSNGIVTAAIGPGGDRPYAVAVQPDGRIVVGGIAFDGLRDVFAITRFQTDGALDASFGASGVAMVEVGALNAGAFGLALQPDGRLLLAGYGSADGVSLDFALLRFNVNGTLDSGFGTGGRVVTPLDTGHDAATSVTVQPDGRILVTGSSHNASTGAIDFALVRYLGDGSLDPAFGSAGVVRTPVSTGADYAYAISVQPDARIVVGGVAPIGGVNRFAVARYTADGALDTSFDTANTLGGTVSYTEGGNAVVLDPDVRVFDAELSAAGSFAGATLTLARNGGASAQDLFSATGTLGALTPGGALVVGGVTVGTVAANSTGTLTLTFDAAATEARVNAVMQQIAYANSSDAPPASVQIDWSFSDANAGVQGSGGALAATGSVTVNITPANDAPVRVVPIGDQGATEDVPFAFTVPAATFSDPDAGDTLTWNATRTNGTALPGWLAFDGATRTFSGTPSDADVGALQVRVSVTDLAGASASDTFLITVGNVNDPPTGLPRIVGSPIEDQTLLVDLASIQDADGLGTLLTGATFQWARNGIAIAGATGASYVPGDSDAGTLISVSVHWTDGRGTTETLVSAAVGPIAPVNDTPAGVPLVAGSLSNGETLGVDLGGISDADGRGTLDTAPQYQWLREGLAIAGATGSSHVLGNADIGALISVTVRWVDGQGYAETLTSDARGPVTATNRTPSGSPIITGSAIEDQTLSIDLAGITDPDGRGTLDTGPGIQWLRNGADIAGATSATYASGDADVGAMIGARVSWVDGLGTPEQRVAPAVGPVANINDAPLLAAPIPDLGAIEDAAFSHTVPADTFTDPDAGDTLAWSASLADGSALPGWLSFDPATHTFSGTPANGDVGAFLLRVSVTDPSAAAASDTFALTIANVNDPPTGRPAVTGAAAVGQILGADLSGIADDDGPGTLATGPQYQWMRDGLAVTGATGATYSVTSADIGQSLSVAVTWSDARGTSEHLSSEATALVSGPASPPPYTDPFAGGPSAGPAPTPPATPPFSPVIPPTPSPSPSEEGSGRDSTSNGAATPPPSGSSAGKSTNPGENSSSSPATGGGNPSAGRSTAPQFAGSIAAANSSPSWRDDTPGTQNALSVDATPPALLPRVGPPTMLQVTPVAMPDTSNARTVLTEVFRRPRERTAGVDATSSTPTSPASLTAATAARPEADSAPELAQLTLGATEVAQLTGLVATTGLMMWAARSGGLTFALLASVPIWRNLDPLYVLPADPHVALSPSDTDDDDLPALVPAGSRAIGRMMVTTDLENG